MTVQFWAWAVIAGVLVLFELIHRDLLVAPFAAGAVVATLLEALGSGPNAQWIALLVVSSVLTVYIQRVVVPRRVRERA